MITLAEWSVPDHELQLNLHLIVRVVGKDMHKSWQSTIVIQDIASTTVSKPSYLDVLHVTRERTMKVLNTHGMSDVEYLQSTQG